jgi:hypothetical protein
VIASRFTGYAEWRGNTEHVVSIVGITLVTVGKLTDSATTAVGLFLIPGVTEFNPVVRTVIHQLGILPGLVVTSLLSLVTIIALTETGAHVSRQLTSDSERSSILILIIGYGLPAGAFVGVTIHNAVLLMKAL